MGRHLKRPTMDADSGSHPCVEAWAQLGSRQRSPQRLQILHDGESSQVYRLFAVGHDGDDVIAKRCDVAIAARERAVYEDYLPRTGLPHPRYYGFVEDPDGRSGWIFVERRKGEGCRPFSIEHRRLVARWIAAWHVTTAGFDDPRFPRQGLDSHLRQLQAARALVDAALADPADGALRSLFQELLAVIDVVESHWATPEAIWSSGPVVLAHYDLTSRNVRVAGAGTIQTFDWGGARWTSPANDLAQSRIEAAGGWCVNPDLDVYWSGVTNAWSNLDPYSVSRIADLGSVLWYVRSIHSLVPLLRRAHSDRSFRQAATCLAELRLAVAALGLS